MPDHTSRYLALRNLDSIRCLSENLTKHPASFYCRARTRVMFFACNQPIDECRLIWTAVVGDLRHF